MPSHYGKDSRYNKIAPFFWYSIYKDVADFVKKCMTCQKQGSLTLKTKTELHSIPVPTAVMNQISVDICNLPEVDGYCCLVVCIDYFRKWSEAKPLKDKTAMTVSQFLYELKCSTAASPFRLMIKVESPSIVFPPNCMVLLAPSSV